MAGWRRVERAMAALVPTSGGMKMLFSGAAMRALEAASSGDGTLATEYAALRQVRNQVVHGEADRDTIDRELIERLTRLADGIEALAASQSH
jgi:hypothetical protein